MPTVATSSLTATHSSENMDSCGLLAPSNTHSGIPLARTRHSHTHKTMPTAVPLPKSSTATTYATADAFSSADSLLAKHKDSLEMIAPWLPGKSRLAPKPKPLSSLPKSRTLSVLTNLTSSLSRSSNRITSFASSTSSSNNTINASSRGPSISSSTAFATEPPVPDPRLIHEAQPSEAWTGRFVRLQDRFQSEMLLPKNLTTLVTAHAERSRMAKRENQPKAGIPMSPSDPNMPPPKHNALIADAEQLEDEDDRARKVFLHLEALCTTSEAKRSLYLWQQNYAKRMGKECLLPRCTT